jgi:predicted TIM-barrel fold metal-dependent hydrolase
MMNLIENVNIEQLMFGSDGGLNSLEKHSYVKSRWEMFDSLDISGSVREQILSVNPKRLFNLKDL